MNQAGFTVSDKCIGCGKCIKVCPGGVLYIGEDRKPHMREFEEIVCNRRSCRRYEQRNVPAEVIDDMLSKLANAPNGGNKQLVEYTLIDDAGQMDSFRKLAYKEMERLADLNCFVPPEDWEP